MGYRGRARDIVGMGYRAWGMTRARNLGPEKEPRVGLGI